MNPISYILKLFDGPPGLDYGYFKTRRAACRMHGAEMFLEEHKFIEACNVFLREIELHLDEISDFDKDKHKILSLFEKFKDIELNLYQRYYYNQLLIRTNERIIPCIIGSQHDICFRN